MGERRVKEMRKEMREIDLEIEKYLREKQQLYQSLSLATGEPIPGVFAPPLSASGAGVPVVV